MPFSINEFVRRRPYLYHLTDQRNVARIRATGRLESAERLFHQAGLSSANRNHRKQSQIISIGDASIHVRDQAPLHRGNMELEPGWDFEDFVAHLNARIFFWPGRAEGPISYGVRHYERYASDQPVILRAPSLELIDSNPNRAPLFCRYNSGSPRCSYGRKSPRKANTFASAEAAAFRGAEVVEVTFEGSVDLPRSTQRALSPHGPWTPFF